MACVGDGGMLLLLPGEEDMHAYDLSRLQKPVGDDLYPAHQPTTLMGLGAGGKTTLLVSSSPSYHSLSQAHTA